MCEVEPPDLSNFVVDDVHDDPADKTVLIGTINAIKTVIICRNVSIPCDIIHNIRGLGSKLSRHNDVYFKLKFLHESRISLDVIYPASDAHIKKYSKRAYNLICENNDTYFEWIAEHESILVTPQWVLNIFEYANTPNVQHSTASPERILFANKEYVIAIDSKWNGDSRDELYLLLLFRNSKLRTLRDLSEYTILESALEDISKVLKDHYDMSLSEVVIFFHYRPTYFQLHLHIVSVNSKFVYQPVGRAIILQDVIEWLKHDKNHFALKRFYFID